MMIVKLYVKKIRRSSSRLNSRRSWSRIVSQGRYIVRFKYLLGPGGAVGLPPRAGAIWSLEQETITPGWSEARHPTGVQYGRMALAAPRSCWGRGTPSRGGAIGGLNQFSPVHGKNEGSPLAAALRLLVCVELTSGARAPGMSV